MLPTHQSPGSPGGLAGSWGSWPQGGLHSLVTFPRPHLCRGFLDLYPSLWVLPLDLSQCQCSGEGGWGCTSVFNCNPDPLFPSFLSQEKLCSFQVYVVPWMNTINLVKFSCQD